MELIIIAAMAANRVIGRNNAIPWRIPEDMAHFKAVTMGHAVIMGRRTYESIGAPLPGRRNIVISSTPSFKPPPDCTVVGSLPEALRLCRSAEKAFIIGGEQLFCDALVIADTMILTMIGRDYAGDAFFPDFSGQPFVLTESREVAAALPLAIHVYRRMKTVSFSGVRSGA